ncbi:MULTISPECIES: hypothetical protein [unclassified Acinetobacter]|nr:MULTISPECIES: hypothetical protein [unclassified Acinetobacter]
MQVLAIDGTDKAQQDAIKYGLAAPTEHRATAIACKTQLQPEKWIMGCL